MYTHIYIIYINIYNPCNKICFLFIFDLLNVIYVRITTHTHILYKYMYNPRNGMFLFIFDLLNVVMCRTWSNNNKVHLMIALTFYDSTMVYFYTQP